MLRIGRIPGVGIVAVSAAHRAALQEYNKAYSGTVYRAKGLYGMDITYHPC